MMTDFEHALFNLWDLKGSYVFEHGSQSTFRPVMKKIFISSNSEEIKIKEGRILYKVFESPAKIYHSLMLKYYSEEYPSICSDVSLAFCDLAVILLKDMFDVYLVRGIYDGFKDTPHFWTLLVSKKTAQSFIVDYTYLQFLQDYGDNWNFSGLVENYSKGEFVPMLPKSVIEDDESSKWRAQYYIKIGI